jgi:hypothetical protein
MTKIRPSRTPEDALCRVVGLLGREQCADIIEKEPSTVHAYGDPDKEKHISLRDAIKLDRACRDEIGETPFFDMMSLVLGSEEFRGRVNLTDALLNLHSGAGRLNEVVRQCQSPQSAGGKRITQQEAKQIENMTDQVLTIIHQIRASLIDGITRGRLAG